MGIIVKRSGPLTTVQDKGRIGYQDMGFSVAGAMDSYAFALANLLLDNPENAAMLEITLIGAEIEFTQDNCFAVTGAAMPVQLNGTPVERNRAYAAKRGDVLSFTIGYPTAGCRAYLAFAGGLDVPEIMGSRSTYLKGKLGGVDGRKLRTGDQIAFVQPKPTLPNLEKREISLDWGAVYGGKQTEIRVVPGPQDDYFTAGGLHTFLNSSYTVTPDFDRMGARLDGPEIEKSGSSDIISDGIAFGAVQVPASGKPIIMLADRQSIGGYPKIANVITVDLPKVVQRQVGDQIKFITVSVEEAQQLLAQREKSLQSLSQEWAAASHKSLWKKLFGRT